MQREEQAWEARCRGPPRGEHIPAGSGDGSAPQGRPRPRPRPARSRDAPGPSWREVTEPLRGEVTRVACGPGAERSGGGADKMAGSTGLCGGGSAGPGAARGARAGEAPPRGPGGAPSPGMGRERPRGEELSADTGEREAAGAPGRVIMESRVRLGQKRPLGWPSPTCDRAAPGQLEQSTQCHVQAFPEAPPGTVTPPPPWVAPSSG